MTAALAAQVRRPVRRPEPDRGAHGGRLVLVHGFTQTRASWSAIADELCHGDGYEVIAVDAPGHGGSDQLHLDLADGALILGNTGGRATYVGYSMGGRLSLQLASSDPALVERLVLVSSTAGIDDGDERQARRQADEHLAQELERDGVAAFIDRWLRMPLFAHLPYTASDVEDRRQNTAAGLAASLRLAGTGAQESLWSRLDSLTMPVLLVVGADDAKFRSIAERMAARLPAATVAVVPDAGHVVHLEQPSAFLTVLREWLATVPAGTAA